MYFQNCFSLVLPLIITPVLTLASSDKRAFFDLTINLLKKGQIIVIMRSNDVLVRISDLKEAGLTLNSGTQEIIQGETYVSLASLSPEVTYELDEKALALRIKAASNLLESNIRNFRSIRPKDIIYTQDTSIFVNYSVSAIDLQQSSRKISAFGEIGLANKNNLLYSSFYRNADGYTARNLTNFTWNNPNSLNRLVLGDTFTQMGNLGGSPLIGGISFSRNFSLDPYFLTTQPFGLQGILNTPSTVELYSNGVWLKREELPPGPFAFSNIPIAAGNTNTKVLIRDAFGKEQEITKSFYFSPELLKRGLSDYSFNLGFIRNNLNDSFKYDSLAFLSRYRQGLTNSLTAGIGLEATSHLISGGGEMNFNTSFGTFGLGASASSSEGFNGYAGLLGYSYISSSFSFSGVVRKFSSYYANSSLKPTDDRSLLETGLQFSVPLGNSISLTTQYITANYRDKGFNNRFSLSSNILVAPKMNLFISASQINQQKHQTENNLFVGLSYFLGNNTTGSISYENQNNQNSVIANLEKPLSTNTGFGYRLRSQIQNDRDIQNATLLYQTNFGRYELNYNRTDSNTSSYNSTLLNAAGGFGIIGGYPFLSRPLDNSYVLVRVPGIQGVRVYLNNNEVGKTNLQGNLIVTNVLPYHSNRLKIATEDIPLNYNIETEEKNIAVPVRAGGVVEFKLVKVQNFIGKIVINDASGKNIIPSYGELTVQIGNKWQKSPLGQLGEFYLENISPGIYPAEVKYQDGKCNFDIKISIFKEQFVNLGTLQCSVKPAQ